MVMTRTGAITLKGTPTDLAGPKLKVGDAAPDFILQNNALEEVSQNSFVEKNSDHCNGAFARHTGLPR